MHSTYTAKSEEASKANKSLQGGGDESPYVGEAAFDGNAPTAPITDRSGNFGATKAFTNGGSYSRGAQG